MVWDDCITVMLMGLTANTVLQEDTLEEPPV